MTKQTTQMKKWCFFFSKCMVCNIWFIFSCYSFSLGSWGQMAICLNIGNPRISWIHRSLCFLLYLVQDLRTLLLIQLECYVFSCVFLAPWKGVIKALFKSLKLDILFTFFLYAHPFWRIEFVFYVGMKIAFPQYSRLSRFLWSWTAVLLSVCLNSMVMPSLTSWGVSLSSPEISVSTRLPRYLQFSWMKRRRDEKRRESIITGSIFFSKCMVYNIWFIFSCYFLLVEVAITGYGKNNKIGSKVNFQILWPNVSQFESLNI